MPNRVMPPFPQRYIKYQFSKKQYCLPWSVPNINLLGLWYQELRASSEFLNADIEVYLYGRYWSNFQAKTSIVELYFSVDLEESVENEDLKPLFDLAYELALSKYRIPIDLTAVSPKKLNKRFEVAGQIERREKTRFDDDFQSNLVGPPLEVTYHNDSDVSCILRHQPRDQNSDPDVIQRVKRSTSDDTFDAKQIVDNGLVFFLPVTLQRLFN